MTDLEKYDGQTPAWCPGCGNFGIKRAFMEAMNEMGRDPSQHMLVSGIGQAGKFPHYVAGNGFNGLHGRALPVATGFRLAHSDMPVYVSSGDGDCYGEGGNHFLHAIRRNVDLTLLVHDNQVYGLTKGQASPTTATGTDSKVQPFGALSKQLNPLRLALAAGCGFVARTFSGNKEHLKTMIKAASEYRGFALVDILQPCVTFNKVNTHSWYKDRVKEIEDSHDASDFDAAFALAGTWGDEIPIGIIYNVETPTMEEQIPVIKDTPLYAHDPGPVDVSDVLEQYR